MTVSPSLLSNDYFFFNLSYILLLLSIVLAFSRLGAAEFVVDTNNPAASDTNPGTSARPFKTILAVAKKVGPGDHVTIHGGDYREVVIINASGTKEAPIIFEAERGEEPVIKGSDVVRGWKIDSGSVWKAELPLLPTPSEDPKEPSRWRTSEVGTLFTKDGRGLDSRALRRCETKSSLRPGMFFIDVKGRTIFAEMEDSSDPNSLQIEAAVRGTWMHIFGDHITFRGIEMRHCANSGALTGPGCFLRGDDITLENCELAWSDHIGVLLAGNGDHLIHCVLCCHGNSAIAGNGDNHIITRCLIRHNNLNRYDPAWHCGGAKLIPNFSHSQITHNEFTRNVGPGLWLDGNCEDNLIEGNFCANNEGPGILVETSPRNRILNNICVGNHNFLYADFLSPEGQSIKGGSYTKFRRIRRGKEGAAQLVYHAGDGRGIQISSSPWSKVFHNTCYLNEGEGICVEGALRSGENNTAMSSHDCLVLNNISVYNKGTQLVLRGNGADKDTYGNVSDYNTIFAVGAILAQTGWNSPLISSLKEWQKLGYDEHSIQDDPAFAMATMNDFRLLPISSSLHVAPALQEVQQDSLNQNRGGARVSMGACENSADDYPRPITTYLLDSK